MGAGLLTLALRKNGAHTRYWLWFSASGKFLIPFSVLTALGSHLHLGWRASAPAPFSPLFEEFARPFYPAAVATPAVTPVAATHAALNPVLILAVVWACGALAVGAYWLVRWLRIQSAVRSSIPLSLNAPIPVRSSASSIEPGVVGLFRPVLLLPEGINERLSLPQFQAILTHELCHVRRRDNLSAAIHMLVEALFWFHPLVWWIGRQLLVERERACDEAVVAAGGDAEVYAEGILAVCKFYLKSPLECAAGVAGADLKGRIERIMTSSITQRLSVARKALLVTATAVAIVTPIVLGSLLATSSPGRAAADEAGVVPFTTVTVRLSQPGNFKPNILASRGGFSTRNFSLRDVITWAYDTQEALVSGPATLDVLYNIEAKAPPEAIPPAGGYVSVETVRAMVRKMLADRFFLQVHTSTEMRPVYVLTTKGTGPRLKEAEPGLGPWRDYGPTSFTGKGVRMDGLIQVLSDFLDHPIVNQTGLTKTYDYDMDWKGESTVDATGNPSWQNLSKPEPEVRVAALESQLGLTARLEQRESQVLVVDRALPPADLLPAYKAVPMDPKLFDTNVGHYELPGKWIMTASREDDHFWTQMQGQPQIEIFPEGSGEFFANAVDAQIAFESDAQGLATGLVLHQNGNDTHAPRMNEAEATATLDAINTKIKENRPTPGSVEALRQSILAEASGKPNYDQMSPELAEAVRAQLPRFLRDSARLGNLASLKFTGVDPRGWDIYQVQFEHGSAEYHIEMSLDGKINGEWLRVLP